MSLQYQSHGDVEMVALPSRLVMANAGEMRKAIKSRVDDGRIRLVLDLKAVDFVDSSGLSVLVYALNAVQARQGDVVLLSPSSAVQSLIELTRLHHVFEIYMDREAAIQRLQ